MTEILRTFSASDPEWDRWLKPAPHDFYSLSGYHAFSENAGEGTAELAVYGTKDQFLAWPYLIRDINGKYRDANSVYGYTGPTGYGLDDAAFLARAWSAMQEVWRSRELVTLFTRFHPLLENEKYCEDFQGALSVPGGEIFHLGRSVSINLTEELDVRWSKYRQALRQEIRRAKGHGIVIKVDHDMKYLEEFVDLYRATMGRNQASLRYQFSRNHFEGLIAALDGNMHLAVAQLDGEIVAAMLFTVYNGIAAAHFAGTDKAHEKYSPLKMLIDGVADIARSLGATHLHLGAGRGGYEDSLYDFKCRFSRSRHNFQTGRWILDPEKYSELSRNWVGEVDPSFFPVYRAPALQGSNAA